MKSISPAEQLRKVLEQEQSTGYEDKAHSATKTFPAKAGFS